MPTIYDSIDLKLLDGLRGVVASATGTGLRVRYFDLRGWDQLADLVEVPPPTA